MRKWWQSVESVAHERRMTHLQGSGAEQDRKFWVAMALYAGLAVLAWFTLGDGEIFIQGKPVEIRWLPLLVIGGMVFRTVLARQAEKIRREGQKERQ